MNASDRATGSPAEVRLNVKAIILIFLALNVFFAAEFFWDYRSSANATNELKFSVAWARPHLANLSRSLNVLAQLVITAVALAVPLTSTMYTPKFIEIFLRDRVNQFVLGFFIVGMGNAIAVHYWLRDNYAPTVEITIVQIQFTLAIAILIPYYFYMFRAIDPSRITVVLAERAKQYLDHLVSRGTGTRSEKDELRERVHHLGNIILRSLDRSDRDVALEAVGALHRVLRHYGEVKDRLPKGFTVPESAHFKGLSEVALGFLERDGTWVERTALHQLELAYCSALAKVPDVVSEIAEAVQVIAVEASRENDRRLLTLAIRYLNNFAREALKRKDIHAIYDTFEHYCRLAHVLLGSRPEVACEIARYFRYYGELARATGTPFVCELVGYDLSRITEWAYTMGAPRRQDILETMLSLEGGDKSRFSLRLTKASLQLATFFRQQKLDAEAERVLASCGKIPEDLLRVIEKDFASAHDPEFWEVTDRQINFDFVPPDRRPILKALIEELRAGPKTPTPAVPEEAGPAPHVPHDLSTAGVALSVAAPMAGPNGRAPAPPATALEGAVEEAGAPPTTVSAGTAGAPAADVTPRAGAA